MGTSVTVAIPVHNYLEGLSWILDRLPGMLADAGVESWSIEVFNDHSDERFLPEFEAAASRPGVRVHHLPDDVRRDLRWSYGRAAGIAMGFGHDAVLTCESDAQPSAHAIRSMLHVYENPCRRPFASVSPMYEWGGRHCYPTGAHWLRDGIGRPGGRCRYHGVGDVSVIDNNGVPFLFVLWPPEVLAMIGEDDTLPPFMSLDGTFGTRVASELGRPHLRVLGVAVGHANGGRMSRRSNPASDGPRWRRQRESSSRSDGGRRGLISRRAGW